MTPAVDVALGHLDAARLALRFVEVDLLEREADQPEQKDDAHYLEEDRQDRRVRQHPERTLRGGVCDNHQTQQYDEAPEAESQE